MMSMEQRPQQIPEEAPELGLTVSDVLIWGKGSLTIIELRLLSEREHDIRQGSFLKLKGIPGEGLS